MKYFFLLVFKKTVGLISIFYDFECFVFSTVLITYKTYLVDKTYFSEVHP